MIDGPYAAAGALTGFVVGLTGVGGGALMTPILLLFFGVPAQTAVATDLWFAAITKTVALPLHQRGDRVDWQVARRLWVGSLPASIAMVSLVAAGVAVGRIAWLSTAVGSAVLVAAVGLLASPVLQRFARERRIADPERFKSRQPLLTGVAGAVLG
ncbi:MAG: TSUP family transporter, partial [Planctomycetota bacterium]